MHDTSFSDRIMIQIAAGGLVGAVADRMLTVGIGMLASLLVGVVMEFVKLRIQAGHKRREAAQIHSPAQTSGGHCAVVVPSKTPTLPGPPPKKKLKKF